MSQRRDRDKATVEVGLTVVALGSIEDELNAAKARVMSLKQRLVMNSFILTASALSPRAINHERYSIILLALVDHKYRFRFINVGGPETCHDSYLYQMSSLSGMVEGPLLKAPVVTIGGVAVPPLVLWDQALPLTPNLIKAFGYNTPLSAEQENFNYHISRVRRVVGNAFGRLKARFRFTTKRMECDIANARLVIRACCVLNNICEHFSDAVQLQWLQKVEQSDSQQPQPERSSD
ncbi:hypothetical protein HPB51_005667 [Rhipicephalus microplus]|uniref:DDE Tnp4 domain-containing protein n=1 Tax=Rhipicephalus microplus TaxID=6941 RepID=A0A9J6EYH4_RHIMP|nr:hypothetical protein HPB51_005667 [Rhipicephalus microplus]